MRPSGVIVIAFCLLGSASAARSDNLYHPGGWPALASDRTARQVGDVLTVLVYESSSAFDSANNNSSKSSKLQGTVSGGSFSKSGGLDLDGGSDSSGSTGRSGQMVAQISVKIDGVEKNGDLDISGQQLST